MLDGEGLGGSDRNDFVRPFIMTGGRTGSGDRRLQLETVVAISGRAAGIEPAFESLSIVDLCRAPRSIAEIAGRLRLPVGVVVVLVADLVGEGLLTVHHTDPVDIELSTLRRMIDRVRAI
jgi:uncharacterized protein DUF742